MDNSVCDIALYIIKEYNDEAHKVFPTYSKEFECGAEDFYLTKNKLLLLLFIIQGLYFSKFSKKAFFENIYISSTNKFEIYIDEIKRIFQPLVTLKKDNRIFFINREYYIPKQLEAPLKRIVDKVLDTWGGYEEWYIKSKLKEFDCVRIAREQGTFNIDISTLAVDMRFAHNKESQGRWEEEDEW